MRCLAVERVEDAIEPTDNFVPVFAGVRCSYEQRIPIKTKNVENCSELPWNGMRRRHGFIDISLFEDESKAV